LQLNSYLLRVVSSTNEVVSQDYNIKNVCRSLVAELQKAFLLIRSMRKYLWVVTNWDFIPESKFGKVIDLSLRRNCAGVSYRKV